MRNLADIGMSSRPGIGLRKVVIVNGSPETLELVESVLDAGRYDITFVESTSHPYALIRQMQPNLVVLCVRIEDVEGFRVLSMLKLDGETERIPVITYTTEYEGQDVDGHLADVSDEDGAPIPRPVLRLH